MKKCLSLLLAILMVLGSLSGCVTSLEEETTDATKQISAGEDTGKDVESSSTEDPAAQEVAPNFMVMSGPTGVGAARLIDDWENGRSTAIANGEIVADNEAVKNALVNGDADIAAVATNLAATLFNKLDGGIQVLAVNTLGVLYILERGERVQSMADLAGKTLYATGQGANPEYILNHLLTRNGVDPATVDIQWMSGQEVIAKMATGEDGICMLPVPAATSLMVKCDDIRQALSLSAEWDALGNGSLAQGCIVVRTEYAQANPHALTAFLNAYAESLAYMTEENNLAEAAQLVAKYEITANARIAELALPSCNLTFVTGQEMKDILVSFYEVMYAADPSSIGGTMPADGFYWGAMSADGVFEGAN